MMPSTDGVLANVSFFSELSDKECKRIARLMTAVDVPAGKVLAREGSVGREFFVILDGDAVVTRDGKVVNRLSRGDHFGEIALLEASPRTATVTAETDMVVEVLSRSEFADLLDEAPQVTLKLLKSLAAILESQALASPD